ncbi:MAG: ECF-type sigma factor, partial [Gimesia chilikensis]
FGAAAIAIRRILVENARARRSLKRGGNAVRLDLEEVLPSTLPEPVEDLIALDEALDRLSTVDSRATELVQLLYFSGLTLSQAAEVMGVSPRTADRLWAYAKAWLRREMRRNSEKSEI